MLAHVPTLACFPSPNVPSSLCLGSLLPPMSSASSLLNALASPSVSLYRRLVSTFCYGIAPDFWGCRWVDQMGRWEFVGGPSMLDSVGWVVAAAGAWNLAGSSLQNRANGGWMLLDVGEDGGGPFAGTDGWMALARGRDARWPREIIAGAVEADGRTASSWLAHVMGVSYSFVVDFAMDTGWSCCSVVEA
ncbi:hypothetical protein ACLOJK_023430 [Asimina triloba]